MFGVPGWVWAILPFALFIAHQLGRAVEHLAVIRQRLDQIIARREPPYED